MSAPKSPYRSWLTKANHDLVALQRIMAEPGAPWDTVCFHAQQSAEKMLKAFLVYHGQQPLKTHSLDRLLTDCVAFEPSLARLRRDCVRLSTYGVDSRYPDIMRDPTKRQAVAAVTAMERIRAAVLPLLSI